MDLSSLFHLSYGLFVVGVNTGSTLNACIINSAIQITANPVQGAIVVNKENYTHDLIQSRGSFALSILAEDVPMETIARFGFSSGRDKAKFQTGYVELDNQGNPYLPQYSTARLSGTVTQTIDVGTHTMFIFTITEGEVLNSKTPLTYKYYQEVKKGTSPKNAPTYQAKEQMVQYYCTICQYIYQGDTPFEQLREDYRCPICSNGKSVFKKN